MKKLLIAVALVLTANVYPDCTPTADGKYNCGGTIITKEQHQAGLALQEITRPVTQLTPVKTLEILLTQIKSQGGGRLPVPNIGRFVGGGATKIDDSADPTTLAEKMIIKNANGMYRENKANSKYWDAIITDIRGERPKDDVYMKLIEKLKVIRSTLQPAS